MCPPVNVRHGAKGMSCLYTEWLYQLVHRDQMKICFACFKAAFLENRLLEMGDWEEPWEDENLELSGSGAIPEEESKPEAGSSGPEAGSSGPEAGSSGPGAGSSGPGAGSSGPGAGSSGPGAGSSGPGAGSSGPGAGSSGPEAGSSGPEAGSSGPEAGSSGPEAGSSEPGAGSSEPEAGSSEPEAGSSGPEAGSSGPEAGSSEPEAGSSGPEAGSSEPEAGSSEPEAGSSEPGEGSSEPGEGSSVPEAGSSEPEAGSSEPEAGSSEPEAGSSEPEAGSSEPEAGSSEPGEESSEPGEESSEPGEESSEPEAGSSEPGEESELQGKSQSAKESQPKKESESGEESQVEDWLGQSYAEGQENEFQVTVVVTNPVILTPGSGTELKPEEAVPLDPGPEDADRNQAFPWKLGRFSPCPHQCTIPPLSLWDIFNEDPHPDQPVLLELSHIWPMNKLIGYCLQRMNFLLVLCGSGTGCYLVSMTPLWVVRTQVHRWQMMLAPGALLVAYLETGPEKQDLNRWRLSMLDSSELGLELVPADCTLRKKGFKVHSYLPWQSEILKDWGREPGERLIIKHMRFLKNY